MKYDGTGLQGYCYNNKYEVFFEKEYINYGNT